MIYYKVHKSSREMGFVSLPDQSLTGWVRTGMRLDLLVGGAVGGVDALAGGGTACGGRAVGSGVVGPVDLGGVLGSG